jgi:Tfp pilus assembly protein PilO
MKIENRQQFLIVLTVAALALLIGNSVIYEPFSNLWSVRSAQIRDLRVKVKDGNNLIKRDAAIRSRWSDMSANTLPANTTLAENQLLTALNNWSRNSGAEIASVTPQWKNDSTNYMTLNCRIEATGTLGALSQFLYQVEKGSMALKPDSVELNAHDPAGQMLTLGLQVSGLALLQPDKK